MTQFGDVLFNVTLADHTGGDMTFNTQNGPTNPLLTFSGLNNLGISDRG